MFLVIDSSILTPLDSFFINLYAFLTVMLSGFEEYSSQILLIRSSRFDLLSSLGSDLLLIRPNRFLIVFFSLDSFYSSFGGSLQAK
jgi:hypothetical protein